MEVKAPVVASMVYVATLPSAIRIIHIPRICHVGELAKRIYGYGPGGDNPIIRRSDTGGPMDARAPVVGLIVYMDT